MSEILFFLGLAWVFIFGHFGFYKIAAIGVILCILWPLIFAFLGNGSNSNDRGRDIGD